MRFLKPRRSYNPIARTFLSDVQKRHFAPIAYLLYQRGDESASVAVPHVIGMGAHCAHLGESR
jgi:hypothetical protein